MTKKWMAFALATVMLMALGLGAYAEESAAGMVTVSAFTPVDDPIGLQRGTHLTVGSTTALGGYFGTEAWGNNTADMDVRSLLHGYTTVAWTRTLGLAMNGVAVSSVQTQEEGDGSRVYTIYLAEGLTYNDGTPITAKDYVFSVLLTGSPVLKAAGGTPKGYGHLVGYEAYQMGQTNVLAGVRLLSDDAFSLHVDAKYLPFFYGLAMLNVTPYPISVIAPGCQVMDDGAGAYISGEFTPDLLKQTLLDPQTGYEHNPKVTSGPYSLESYDAASSTATFVVNEQYKGNYEGQKPHIERLTLKHVQNDTMIGQLESGEIGLLNKVVEANAVQQGRTMAMEEGKAQASTYLRTGFSFLSFACEDGATASQAVRRAVAMSFDKDAFTGSAAGTSARRVYGYYGLGQWMALYSAEESGGNPAVSMPEELQTLDVPQDLAGAKALLEADGWTLDASGNAYTEGTRYKQGASGLEPLEIRWAKTQGSTVANALEAALTEPLRSLGFNFVVTELPFNEMLSHYYRQEARTYNMFYLASNFTYVFDPYYDFNTADVYQGMTNATGLKDEQLMQLALEMRETPSTDMYGYAQKWLSFQRRFVELMPMVPLYSNVYFDFFSHDLQGYDIAGQSGWALAIPYAYLNSAGVGESTQGSEGAAPPESGEISSDETVDLTISD